MIGNKKEKERKTTGTILQNTKREKRKGRKSREKKK